MCNYLVVNKTYRYKYLKLSPSEVYTSLIINCWLNLRLLLTYFSIILHRLAIVFHKIVQLSFEKLVLGRLLHHSCRIYI